MPADEEHDGKILKLVERIDELERRVEQLEKENETKVRVVDTDKGKKIVLENRQQTWFSPNYFRKILERIDEGEE